MVGAQVRLLQLIEVVTRTLSIVDGLLTYVALSDRERKHGWQIIDSWIGGWIWSNRVHL